MATLIVGSIVSISIGFCNLNWPSQAVWPHFLLLSFYIFAGICVFMVIVTLLTKNEPSEEQLPTLKQTYKEQGSRSTPIWLLWILSTKPNTALIHPPIW